MIVPAEIAMVNVPLAYVILWQAQTTGVSALYTGWWVVR
jgi:hypothetical protein